MQTSVEEFQRMELEFLMDVDGLRKRIQMLYDETRALAQQSRWVDHLSQAVLLLGCFHYLGWKQWISRIMGRMAWSYIKLKEYGHAKRLLGFSERYHEWQSAANYYWAGEYSFRSNNDNWGREFTAEFRRICKNKLGLAYEGDLELAVKFYEKLVEQESSDILFLETNNQSDLGRYLELRGRFSSSPQDFWDAAVHYELAGLHTYAYVNRAFYYICLARQPHNALEQKTALYKSALKEIAGRPIFADNDIRDLLQRYLEVRIACCEIILGCEAASRDPASVVDIEVGYKTVHKVIRGDDADSGEGSKPIATIAARFISLSRRRAWLRLLEFIDGLDTVVCPTDLSRALTLNECLDGIQPFLPSLTFLATREEE
jgi:hypothetical protein